MEGVVQCVLRFTPNVVSEKYKSSVLCPGASRQCPALIRGRRTCLHASRWDSHLTAINEKGLSEKPLGGGGGITCRLLHYLAVDTEANRCPIGGGAANFPVPQALLGARAGIRFGKVGFFGKIARASEYTTAQYTSQVSAQRQISTWEASSSSVPRDTLAPGSISETPSSFLGITLSVRQRAGEISAPAISSKAPSASSSIFTHGGEFLCAQVGARPSCQQALMVPRKVIHRIPGAAWRAAFGQSIAGGSFGLYRKVTVFNQPWSAQLLPSLDGRKRFQSTLSVTDNLASVFLYPVLHVEPGLPPCEA